MAFMPPSSAAAACPALSPRRSMATLRARVRPAKAASISIWSQKAGSPAPLMMVARRATRKYLAGMR